MAEPALRECSVPHLGQKPWQETESVEKSHMTGDIASRTLKSKATDLAGIDGLRAFFPAATEGFNYGAKLLRLQGLPGLSLALEPYLG